MGIRKGEEKDKDGKGNTVREGFRKKMEERTVKKRGRKRRAVRVEDEGLGGWQ